MVFPTDARIKDPALLTGIWKVETRVTPSQKQGQGPSEDTGQACWQVETQWEAGCHAKSKGCPDNPKVCMKQHFRAFETEY